MNSKMTFLLGLLLPMHSSLCLTSIMCIVFLLLKNPLLFNLKPIFPCKPDKHIFTTERLAVSWFCMTKYNRRVLRLLPRTKLFMLWKCFQKANALGQHFLGKKNGILVLACSALQVLIDLDVYGLFYVAPQCRKWGGGVWIAAWTKHCAVSAPCIFC